MNAARTISLPEELCVRAETKFRHRFKNVDELVAAVIAELLRDDAAALDIGEEKIIEERLKGLGYI